ncbi:protein FAF-like, chloroplastic [Impatiens glandulifera]|uniref:protein FAF-like, chloroplastic n=1 Tax=Impatiens glandulifera TaxID=253017 RepID=UPI001FB0F17D|nr:protein FAF-like, chloroplastic [Impatiens glandulifera]XP_047321633.1 protein FAF-like, chloroplastic [Impatiens glandulifera]
MLSGAVGKCLLLASPLKVEEETKVINEKQGIVSILLSEPTQAKIATSSLRRNLSADMSSAKWLPQNGLSSSMKKIASSEQLAISLEDNQDDEEKVPEQDDVWRSIQLKKKKTEVENEKPVCTQLDTWSSILSQNAKEDSNNLPPYVHPLAKTSTGSLSEKSLQICTESLGSETGSEGFSSYTPPEKSESEEDKEEEEVQQKEAPVEKYSDPCDREEWQAIKCMYSTKSTTPRSFPPPLPSLAQSVGPTLHMQSRRLEGRLLLEAVSVPSQNCFHAQRQDGRLVLQLHDNQNLSEMKDEEDEMDEEEMDPVDDIDVDNDIYIDEDFESELEDEMDGEVEEMVTQELITAPRSTIPFKNIMRIDNKSPTWPPTNRINKEEIEVESDQEEELEELTAMPQSLPPVARLIRAPAGAAGSFNAYDYFWRTKPTMINPINQQSPAQKYSNNMTILPNSSKADKQQEPVFLRGNNAEYLVPLVRGCNDSSKKSLQICEPYCVATS